ncbi:MAG: glycosyltransferase family 39 protein [bacterium]
MKKRRAAKEKRFFFTKEVFIVAGLLVLALILRLIYLSHLKIHDPSFYLPPDGTDMLTYHNYALQILNGTFGKEPYYYGPLYSYFLALVYKIFGVDPYIARLIQMLLGVATSLLTYLIARKVFNKAVALISISISIFYGMFYIHEGLLLLESLSTFLITLSILLLLRIKDNPNFKTIAYVGISLGLSGLARPNILLFVPFILIWLLIPHPFSLIPLKKFAFLCLVIALIISPVTIRNWLVSGRFVLISTNGPVLFWISNNPYATGEYSYPPSDYNDKITKMVKEKGDKVYFEEVIKFFRERPKDFVMLQVKKFLLFWSNHEIANNMNYELLKSYSFLFKFPILGSFGMIAPFSLCGIFLALRRKGAFLLHYFILSFMLAMIAFHILGRHRLSCIPILIIFSSYYIWWLYDGFINKKTKSIVLSLILLLVFTTFVRSQSIIGKLYPLFHNESIVSKKGDKIAIRDDSGIWQGGDFITLSPNASCKKELFIKEDVSDNKGISLFFNYQVTKPGTLILDINGVKGGASLSSTDLMNISSINLPPSTFHQGLNIITFLAKDIEILIPIDSSYTFGRSYLLKNGKWEKLKKGEFMVWLELVKENLLDKN